MGQKIFLCKQTVYYAFAWALSYLVWAEKAHKATINGKGKRACCILREGTSLGYAIDVPCIKV